MGKTRAKNPQASGMNQDQVTQALLDMGLSPQEAQRAAPGLAARVPSLAEVQRVGEIQKRAGDRGLTSYELDSGFVSPDYESLRDASGNLSSKYQYDPNQSEAFKSIRDQAFQTGPSAWAQLQTQRQGLEEGSLKDQAARSAAQGGAMAQADLARLGGLSSGARQRIGMQSARDLMLQKQNVGRQGMMDRLGISQTDEDRRQGLLKDVATAETGAQQSNLQTLMGDVANKRQFEADRYAQQMGGWAAGKTADAQASAAKKAGKKK